MSSVDCSCCCLVQHVCHVFCQVFCQTFCQVFYQVFCQWSQSVSSARGPESLQWLISRSGLSANGQGPGARVPGVAGQWLFRPVSLSVAPVSTQQWSVRACQWPVRGLSGLFCWLLQGFHAVLLTVAWFSCFFADRCMVFMLFCWQLQDFHAVLLTVAWLSCCFADSCMVFMLFYWHLHGFHAVLLSVSYAYGTLALPRR